MSKFSVSLIIPAYNEEDIIYRAVRRARDILLNAKTDFEIIVVNDGSSDRTKKILEDNFITHPEIFLINKDINEGIGAAIRDGINISSKEFIFCVPADSPLTEDVFVAFFKSEKKADIIVSYRKKRLGYSLRMKINSWVYHLLVSHMFQMDLRDYNWIHMYNRKIFDEGKIQIEYNGIFMLAEILIKAKRKKFTIQEVEVEQYERLTGIATASKVSAIIKTLIEIISFRLKN